MEKKQHPPRPPPLHGPRVAGEADDQDDVLGHRAGGGAGRHPRMVRRRAAAGMVRRHASSSTRHGARAAGLIESGGRGERSAGGWLVSLLFFSLGAAVKKFERLSKLSIKRWLFKKIKRNDFLPVGGFQSGKNFGGCASIFGQCRYKRL